MARAALGWSAQYLAEASGLSWGTIQRAEQFDGVPGRMKVENLTAIKAALERAGCVFIAAGEISDKGGEGVRLRK